MRLLEGKITCIERLAKDVFLFSFQHKHIAKTAKPGQFLHIRINREGILLRRPFSIHKIEGNNIFILFKVKGKGTSALSSYRVGERLDVLGPLGNGFVINSSFSKSLSILVAGGMGVAGLVFLAEKLSKKEDNALVLLGAKTKTELYCERYLKKMGCTVLVATEDGSRGFKGKVTDLLKHTLRSMPQLLDSSLYACGPKEMFYSLKNILDKYPGITPQVSFEQFMGCGIGICLGCVIETGQGYKRVCKDGPVFNLKDILVEGR